MSSILPTRRIGFRSDIRSGLVGRWQLNEASGNAIDSSGLNRPLLTSGGGAVGAGSGVAANSRGPFTASGAGGAFETSPSDSRYWSDLSQTTFTISAWFYKTEHPAVNETSMIWSVYDQHTGGYDIRSHDGLFVIFMRDGSNVQQYAIAGPGVVLDLNVWHHIVVTLNQLTRVMTVRHNGTLYSTAINPAWTFAVPYYGQPASIGRFNYWAGGQPHKGFLAKLRVYSRALADADQLTLYNSGDFATAP